MKKHIHIINIRDDQDDFETEIEESYIKHFVITINNILKYMLTKIY